MLVHTTFITHKTNTTNNNDPPINAMRIPTAKQITTSAVILGAAVLLVPSPQLNAQAVTNLAPAYRVVDLGSVPGWPADYVIPLKINDAGQVAGILGPFTQPVHAFFWDPSTGMQVIGPNYGQTWTQSLNNNGVVAGAYGDPSSDPIYCGYWFLAFEWDSTNGLR